MFPLILTPAVTSALCVLVARTVGGPFADIYGERNEEIERKPASSSSAIEELKEMNMDQLVSVLVEKIEQRSPEVIKALQGIDKEDAMLPTLIRSPRLKRISTRIIRQTFPGYNAFCARCFPSLITRR